MTTQITQVLPQAPDAGLFGDISSQTSPRPSFQQYLDQEQQRLGLTYSPFAQFNFGSWLAYPDFAFKNDSQDGKNNYFSDSAAKIEELSAQIQKLHRESNPPSGTTGQNQEFNQQAMATFSKPAQALLQDLLLKAGWLTPNLAANPLLLQAQADGQLLAKFDLQSLVDEIVSLVKLVKDKGKTELSLGLKPENLGEILLTLTSRSGLVSIQIQAPEETKKLLQDELAELERALKKAQVNFAEIKITSIKEVTEHV